MPKKNIDIVVGTIFSIISALFIISGRIKIFLKSFGYIPTENVFLYQTHFKNFIFILAIMGAIGYLFSDSIREIYKFIREKEKKVFQIENIGKISVILCLFLAVVMKSRKYGLRVTGYILIPTVIYWIIKNRKKIKIDISDFFMVGFCFAILVSSKNALHTGSVIGEFQDNLLIFLLPLAIKQLNYGNLFKNLLINWGLIAFSFKILMGYFEKVGIIQGLYWGSRISGGEEVWRYAGIIMLGIIYLVYQLVFVEKKWTVKAIEFFYLIVALAPMIWSQNRANWVAIILTFFIMVIVKNFKRGILIIIFSLILLTGIIKSDKINNPYINRVKTIVSYKNDTSSTGRIELWKESIHMFKEFPMTGIGYSYKNFTGRERYSEYKIVPNDIPHGHSHNSYLYVLATMGIVGVAMFLGMNISLLYRLLIMKTKSSQVAFYILISWLIMGLFETPIKYFDMLTVIMIMVGYAFSSSKINELKQ